MKKRIFAFLLCIGTMTVIFGSSAITQAAAMDWTSIRSIVGGVGQMVAASKTTFEGIRTPIRDNGLSNVISFTPVNGYSGTYNGSTGYSFFKSGSYTMPASSIASGKIFKYCVLIQDGSSNIKALIYFDNIEKPYSSGSLIVMLPEFFDVLAPVNTMIELYCYNDGTTPSIKISYANTDGTKYKIRALAQQENDIIEISTFIYKIAGGGIGYYTVAYAAKTTGSNYSTAIQGADATSITPTNNGLGFPGSGTGDRGYGRFTSDSGGSFINDLVNDDLDTNYPTRTSVTDIYTSMTTGLISFFNVGGGTGLKDLTISFASYPTI